MEQQQQQQTPTFTGKEETRIYKSFHGWQGETRIKLNGKNWELTTSKRNSGKISTHCHTVEDEGNGNISYCITSMFDSNSPENFYLNELPRGTTATENTIRTAHLKSLVLFDKKNEAGELPAVKPDDYKIEIGQVFFTDGFSDDNRRAVYEIIQEGRKFKTVFLDGSQTKQDDHVKPYSKKFGIGTYYNEGDTISQDEVNNLLIDANKNMEIEADRRKAQEIINKEKAKAQAEYLSQFIQADRRQTTNIIKRHIFKTWPTVQKVEVKTDSFSMGDSMDVWYYAPEKIEALESFIDNFKEGSFDGMTDMYNYHDREAIILEGHILQTYKYSSSHYHKAEAIQTPTPTQATEPGTNNGMITVRINEAKNGVEVVFKSKPQPEVLDLLKENRFRWSRFAKLWYITRTPQAEKFAYELQEKFNN